MPPLAKKTRTSMQSVPVSAVESGGAISRRYSHLAEIHAAAQYSLSGTLVRSHLVGRGGSDEVAMWRIGSLSATPLIVWPGCRRPHSVSPEWNSKLRRGSRERSSPRVAMHVWLRTVLRTCGIERATRSAGSTWNGASLRPLLVSPLGTRGRRPPVGAATGSRRSGRSITDNWAAFARCRGVRRGNPFTVRTANCVQAKSCYW